MPTTSPNPVLSDAHIDLLITAATTWRLLASTTAVAFSRSVLEQHVVVASATQAGRMLRTENHASVRWLSQQGRTRLVERSPSAAPYIHQRVDHLDPVEVIKASQAAQAACQDSPTWSTSPAARLLAALITAATHRLPGYADAPWSWTRPQLRSGRSVGVALPGTFQLTIPSLTWVPPDQLREHWTDAPLVVIRCDAATSVPADLPSRSGVFVLALEGMEDANRIWQAVTALHMPALVTLWPACSPWLQHQLREPSPEFTEHRTLS